MPYRYRPADNRTPVLHPVYGHLQYDGIYDDDRMAGDPDFKAVPAPAAPAPPAPVKRPDDKPSDAPAGS